MNYLPVNLKTSSRGVTLLKKEEGFRARAYKCPTGHWTIGFGHKILKSEAHLLKASLTVEQATELLMRDIAIAENGVKRLIVARLTQGMFDALVSLVFNLGATKLKGKGVILKINGRAPLDSIAASFLAWNKGRNPETGALEVIPGLAKRRKNEWALFVS